MQKFGIDTSRWNGNFDFAKAKKNHGVQFAILKIGGGDNGLYKDKEFDNSYKKCVACGLDKGAYFFGRAMNMADAKKEAEYIISLLKGYKLEYPIFYDVEADMLKVDKATLTNIIKYVLSTVEKAGYWVGLYGSSYHLELHTNDAELKMYSHWAASWQKTKPKFKNSDVQMWQFGGETNLIRSNKINGMIVDQDYCYIDYPSLIKAKGLNGYTAPKPVVKPAPTTKKLVKGAKVKVKPGAKFYDGKQPAKFVYTNVYDVIKLVDDDRAVIGIGSAVTGVMKKENLIVQ